MNRPCLDCGEPTPRTRCVNCERAYDRARRPSGGRRYPSSWRKARAKAIAKSPRCADCGTTQDLTGGHIVPRVYGGTERDGIVVQCRRCNSARGARQL